MRLGLCLLLAACSSSRQPEAAGAPPTPAPAREVVKHTAPVHATHGSNIVALAVTGDGGAVVSADQQGGIRLWPVLDGTREPIVVFGPAPRALGIARDRDGFVIADHDQAGGVVLVRIGPQGEARGEVALPAEPKIEQLEMTATGALVLRADQTIALVDASGVAQARLVPESGTHVTALVTRGAHALAIEVDGTAVHAHAIELVQGGARWGERSAALTIDPAREIVLSPDGKVIAAIQAKDQAPAVFELGTGKASTKLACGAIARHVEDSTAESAAAFQPRPIGFTDATTLACSINDQLQWWNTVSGELAKVSPPPISIAATPFVVTDGRAIGGVTAQLGLFAPNAAQYLGYGFRELTHVRIGPTGLMIGKGDQKPLLLDGRLHERARFELPKQNVDWTDLIAVDDRYVITIANRPESQKDAWGNAYQVAIYDAVTRTVHQQLPYRAHDSEITYDPETRLMVSSDAGSNLLLRFDPATHAFGEQIELSTKLLLKKIYLVDPALADGIVAIGVQEDGGGEGVTVVEFHGDDLGAASVAPRRTYKIAAELRAVDRAGRLYVHGAKDQEDVIGYDHGRATTRLVGVAALGLRPNLDGTRLAAFGGQRIVLLARDGTRIWETAAWGSTDVGWMPSGELFARFQGALAKLDPSTGALVDRQCGWAFGLSAAMFETSAATPLVCDVSP